MEADDFGPEPPLALLLLLASRRLDGQALHRLEEQGWPRLSPAQSLLFAHLGEGGISPVELARRMGQSRQATHELVHGLIGLNLLMVTADPSRRAGRLIAPTEAGRQLSVAAYQILMGIEFDLGADVVTALRRLLSPLADLPTWMSCELDPARPPTPGGQ